MKLTCPACGAEFTLDVLIAHEGARDALIEAMGMNAPLGKRLIAYLGLFRPAQRQLTMDRVAKILKEISPSIRDRQIVRNGRAWAIPLESWTWGLDEIVIKAKTDKLTLPLKSHGYLYEMLIAAADKVEAKAEQESENRRASGALPSGQASMVRSTAAPVTDLVRKKMPSHVLEAARALRVPNKGEDDGTNSGA
jgi:hypothetical protein